MWGHARTLCIRCTATNSARVAGSRETIGLRPVIDATFGLEDLKAAFAHEIAGAHFGKICVEF